MPQFILIKDLSRASTVQLLFSRWELQMDTGTELGCHFCHSSLWDWVKNVASESPLRALPSLQQLCWEISSCVWCSWNVQLPGELAVTVLQSKMEWAQDSFPQGLQGLSLQNQELQSENPDLCISHYWVDLQYFSGSPHRKCPALFSRSTACSAELH